MDKPSNRFYREKEFTDAELAGAIAYQLTKLLVIDMPTARAAVDAAMKDARGVSASHQHTSAPKTPMKGSS